MGSESARRSPIDSVIGTNHNWLRAATKSDMLHAGIHILTVAAMFGHAVLGCCCHHAHGSSANCRHYAGGVAGVTHDAHGQDHRHATLRYEEACDHGTRDDGRPDEHRPCEEKRCTYVITKPAEVCGLTFSSTQPVLTVPITSLPAHETVLRHADADHRLFSAPQLCAVLGVFRL